MEVLYTGSMLGHPVDFSRPAAQTDSKKVHKNAKIQGSTKKEHAVVFRFRKSQGALLFHNDAYKKQPNSNMQKKKKKVTPTETALSQCWVAQYLNNLTSLRGCRGHWEHCK